MPQHKILLGTIYNQMEDVMLHGVCPFCIVQGELHFGERNYALVFAQLYHVCEDHAMILDRLSQEEKHKYVAPFLMEYHGVKEITPYKIGGLT